MGQRGQKLKEKDEKTGKERIASRGSHLIQRR